MISTEVIVHMEENVSLTIDALSVTSMVMVLSIVRKQITVVEHHNHQLVRTTTVRESTTTASNPRTKIGGRSIRKIS